MISMADAFNSPLSTLMKKKYGLTKQSTLRFTDKDNLFSQFKKTAAYIYKNSEWNEQNKLETIKQYLENRDSNTEVYSLKKLDNPNKLSDSQFRNYVTSNSYDVYEYTSKIKDAKSHYLLLDPNNKNWKHQGESLCFRFGPSNTNWIEGNESHTLGYGKLCNDIIKEYQQKPTLNNIVVDFRKTSEIYSEDKFDHEQWGINSFVHEYGHYLDYQLAPGKEPLSLQAGFQSIIDQYRKQLAINDDKQKRYFSIPTEIFARGWELYCHNNGLKGDLIGQDKEYKYMQEYNAFDGFQDKIEKYFDSIPEIKQIKPELSLDTRQEIAPDKQQNAPELKNTHKLKEFAQDMLHKWTDNVENLESLITATGTSLSENNPNRLIAYDRWQEGKLPRLVSETQLKKVDFPINDYQVSSVQGFEPQNDEHYVSKKFYNYDELAKLVAKKDPEGKLQDPNNYAKLKSIPDSNQHRQYENKAVVEAILKKHGIKPIDSYPDNQPLAKAFSRVSHRLLEDALRTKPHSEPFRFTKEEHDALIKQGNGIGKYLYLTVTGQARETLLKVAPSRSMQIEKKIAKKKARSYGAR